MIMQHAKMNTRNNAGTHPTRRAHREAHQHHTFIAMRAAHGSAVPCCCPRSQARIDGLLSEVVCHEPVHMTALALFHCTEWRPFCKGQHTVVSAGCVALQSTPGRTSPLPCVAVSSSLMSGALLPVSRFCKIFELSKSMHCQLAECVRQTALHAVHCLHWSKHLQDNVDEKKEPRHAAAS